MQQQHKHSSTLAVMSRNSIAYYIITIAAIFLSMLAVFAFLQPAHAMTAQADEDAVGRVKKVHVVKSTVHTIKINWKQITDAEEYNIRVLDADMEAVVKTAVTEKNRTTIKNLDSQTRYYLQVRAYDEDTDSYGKWSKKKATSTKTAKKIKDLPDGIASDALPNNVRLYKNPTIAQKTGAMQLAMGDLYDELIESYQNYSPSTSSQQSLSAQGSRSAKAKFNWVNAMSHRVREVAAQNEANDNDAAGDSSGDPHILTFDGLKYDNMSRGVFWLVQDTKEEFSVQTIQRYVEGSSAVSYNSGVAANAHGHTVAFNVKDKNFVTLDGEKLKLTGNRVVVWPGAMLMRMRNQFVLITEEDHNLLLRLEDWLAPEVFLNKTVQNRYSGLLGNANNIPYDDLSSNSGVSSLDEIGAETQSLKLALFMDEGATALQLPIQTFYDSYIEPWVAAEEDSYFASKEYVDYLPPADLVRLEDLELSDIQTAREACIATSDVADAKGVVFGCVYDNLVGGMAVDTLVRFMNRSDGKPEPTVWIDLE